MFPTAYVDACKTKFYFCQLFLVVPFLACQKIIWERLGKTAVPTKKGSLGKDIPSIGTLVGLLLALTWQAASALLGLASLPLTSWRGLCRQSDWPPYWLCARTHIPGDCSWSIQGQWPNFAASSTSGSLKSFFYHQWLVCSNMLACPWWSLEGLLMAAQNWPISYQKVLEKPPQLVSILRETAFSKQLFSM